MRLISSPQNRTMRGPGVLGNPSAPPGNPLATIGNPLAIIGKLPTISKSTIQDFQVGVDGFPGNW